MAFQPKRRRHPISATIIEFRRVLNVTQAQFGKMMNLAAVSIGLWETTAPPQRQQIVRLRMLAEREAERCKESDPAKFLKLKTIAQKFRTLRIDEALSSFGDAIQLFRATEEQPPCGYVFMKLETKRRIDTMRSLKELWAIADSDPKTPDELADQYAAVKALEAVNKALKKIKPATYEKLMAESEKLTSIPRLTITNEPEWTTTQ